MKQYAGQLLAFVAGVLLTVGVYETVRLVTNARQALSAASSQLSAASDDAVVDLQDPAARKQTAKKKPAPNKAAPKKKPKPPVKKTAQKPVAQPGTGKGGKGSRQAAGKKAMPLTGELTPRQKRIKRIRKRLREKRKLEGRERPREGTAPPKKAEPPKEGFRDKELNDEELTDEQLLEKYPELEKVRDTGP